MSINILALAKRVRAEQRSGLGDEKSSVSAPPTGGEEHSDAASITSSQILATPLQSLAARREIPKLEKFPAYADDIHLKLPNVNTFGKLEASAGDGGFCVGKLPTVMYFNSVISKDAAADLIRVLDNESISHRWVDLKKRRLQKWGGDVLSDGLHNLEALPKFLENLSQQLVDSGLFPSSHKPNHVLINEYHAGEGILPHTDGPAYYPKVATLSIGCDALMYFTPSKLATAAVHAPQQLVLRAGSLVVFSDEAYTSVLHSIEPAIEEVVGEKSECVNLRESEASIGERLERTRRISLTIRHVPLAAP